MRMEIVVVAQYLRDIENFEGNNSRFVYLAKMLRDKQCDVEIITSNYNHSAKKHFSFVGDLREIQVTPIEEPGYPKNVSFKRFWSHKRLAKNISHYLETRKKPDVLYLALPSLAVGEVCADYCKKNNVRLIVDIQDLWPEAFKMILNLPVVSSVLFFPMKRQADKIYKAADKIVAVSKTFADRGMSVNKKCRKPTVAYLGTEKASFDQFSVPIKPASHEIVISYVGSLEASYDLETVIDAVSKMTGPARLLVMGDGSNRERFEKYASQKGIQAEFTGKLEYSEMASRLSCCDIAVNPIRKGSMASIINKVNDYAMAGLPVVNTQECEEYRNLLDEYQAGINCRCGSAEDVLKAIQRLSDNEALRKQMGSNSRRLGEEKFDRASSYAQILKIIIGDNA